MSSNVDDYINAVPPENRHKLNMVIDFGEKYRDGSLKEDHLLKIAKMMDSWEGEVALALELGAQTQEAIKKDNTKFDNQKYVVHCTQV